MKDSLFWGNLKPLCIVTICLPLSLLGNYWALLSMYGNLIYATENTCFGTKSKSDVAKHKKAFPKHQLNLNNVSNWYFISLNYASFQHLNKNFIQAKWQEAVICILLVSFLNLEIFCKLCLESWEFWGKDYSFKKITKSPMWRTGSWKWLPRIIAWVFLSCNIKRFEANQAESMIVFPQISTALE